MTHEFLTDRSHVLISGVTGARSRYGGKTALANWWLCEPAQRDDLRIFLNPKHDEEVRGRSVASVEELAREMRDGHRHFDLAPQSSDWETVSERLMMFVRALPQLMSKTVVIDEAPEMDEEALLTMVRVLGNMATCKTLLLAQAPGDLPVKIRRQVVLAWVGPFTGSNAHVFEANDLGAHVDHLHEQGPYEWSVILGPAPEDRVEFAPVPEEFAGDKHDGVEA